jgi:ABC-type sugar transport system permease subunit
LNKRKFKKGSAFEKRQNKMGYLFMLPWIIGFIIFTALPFAATIVLSFTEIKQNVTGFDISFVGTANYKSAFFTNTSFTPALVEFLWMIIPYTLLIVVISFVLAFLLNRIKVFKSALRTIYFLPVIVLSGPVMYQLMDAGQSANEETTRLIYDNIILDMIENFSPYIANALIGICENLSVILWFTGIPIVLFINGLQKINPSMYEAAKIDSANSWQILWKITMPMIRNTALVCSVFTIAQLGSMDSVNPVLALIKEATANTSGGFGFAATYSWIYSLLVLVIIGLAFLLLRERKNTERHVK